MAHPLDLVRARFSTKWEERNGCWVWTAGRRALRYGQFWIGGEEHAAHRAAWMLYRGKIPNDMHVCHRCDEPLCVKPSHLFLGTHAENMADMDAKGRRVILCGEENGNAKLSEDQVQQIRRLCAEGWQQRDIAGAFGVVQTAVSAIWTGRKWGHLKWEPA